MGAKTALIIGAGPAGLTAALELAKRTEIRPLVFEKSEYMGGISRTVQYHGNRIDIGGHRFFSKSDRVMKWWTDILPVQGSGNGTHQISYRRQTRLVDASECGPDPEQDNRVMLVRSRKSRIYFLRRFFDYPISLTPDTVRKLGVIRMAKIGASYAAAALRPRSPEATLEDFLINRFGRELYLTFFKSYTEKVWGVPCDQISAEWGAQRIKGLSVKSAITHFIKRAARRRTRDDIAQKATETSLIENFLYPKFGPGQLWECVAEEVQSRSGEIRAGWSIEKLYTNGSRITGALARQTATGLEQRIESDYFFSTMPVKELISSLDAPVPANVRDVAEGLQYRDFITVGLLLKELRLQDLTDNWIYIQEADVQVGRMQIFNNWSPYMVRDPGKVWVGLEYFCCETDAIWEMTDQQIVDLAGKELSKIGIVRETDIIDACVIRVPKAYPAYFGSYARFGEIRQFVDRFENLFLLGRNGMHKYNNQDHSMLTAMTAVDNIIGGIADRSNIWALNTEMEYHEASAEKNSMRTAA